jgi:hypothetical protein
MRRTDVLPIPKRRAISDLLVPPRCIFRTKDEYTAREWIGGEFFPAQLRQAVNALASIDSTATRMRICGVI